MALPALPTLSLLPLPTLGSLSLHRDYPVGSAVVVLPSSYAPDGYEGTYYTAKVSGLDLLLARTRQEALEGEGSVWIHRQRIMGDPLSRPPARPVRR